MDVAAVCLLTLEAQPGNGQMIFATPVLQATVGLRPLVLWRRAEQIDVAV